MSNNIKIPNIDDYKINLLEQINEWAWSIHQNITSMDRSKITELDERKISELFDKVKKSMFLAYEIFNTKEQA